MVKDSEIKAKVSPFAIKEGEIKQFDGYEGYVSIVQITNKIDRNHITELEYKILEYVDKYEFMTSRQINMLLEMDGIHIENGRKMVKKLDQMLKTKLLSRYYFGSLDEKAAYKVYCLEKNAKHLLEAREIKVKWKPTDNTKPVAVMKRVLATNQLVLAIKSKCSSYKSDIIKKVLVADKENELKANAFITLAQGITKIDVAVEAIRREKNWEEKLLSRLNLYKNFFDTFKPGTEGMNEKPYILFVCEDKKHMAEVYKVMVMNNIDLEGRVYFTYDLLQMEPSLENTWHQFIHEDQKIKLQPLNIELLK